MTQIAPETIRLPFITQQPHDDGCGGAVLQMLTGLSESEIARLIGWADGAVRHSRWQDMTRVLAELGWDVGTPQAASRWEEIGGIAVVHVQEDHFMLYDGDNGLFYDPDKWQGPSKTSDRVPMSYLSVQRPG